MLFFLRICNNLSEQEFDPSPLPFLNGVKNAEFAGNGTTKLFVLIGKQKYEGLDDTF